MRDQIITLLNRYPALTVCADAIEAACREIIRAYEQGGLLLTCGNGGSCADAEHIAGEFMKGFCRRRPLGAEARAALSAAHPDLGPALAEKLQQPLRTVSLNGMPALSTAFQNDVDPALVYAQQALAFASPTTVLLGISTSGNACNVLAAAVALRSGGGTSIGLTGAGGGRMPEVFDIVIKAPETETYRVQELHLPIYHAICLAVEAHFFKE